MNIAGRREAIVLWVLALIAAAASLINNVYGETWGQQGENLHYELWEPSTHGYPSSGANLSLTLGGYGWSTATANSYGAALVLAQADAVELFAQGVELQRQAIEQFSGGTYTVLGVTYPQGVNYYEQANGYDSETGEHWVRVGWDDTPRTFEIGILYGGPQL